MGAKDYLDKKIDEGAWDRMWGREQDQLVGTAREALVNSMKATFTDIDEAVIEARVEKYITSLVRELQEFKDIRRGE